MNTNTNICYSNIIRIPNFSLTSDLYRFTLKKFVGIACSLCMIDTPMSSSIKDRGIPWQILMPKSPDYRGNSISDGVFHCCKRFQGNSLSHLGRGTKDYRNSWGDDGGEGKDNFNWDHFAEGLLFWRAMFCQGTSIMIMLRDCALMKLQIEIVCISCHKCELATY